MRLLGSVVLIAVSATTALAQSEDPAPPPPDSDPQGSYGPPGSYDQPPDGQPDGYAPNAQPYNGGYAPNAQPYNGGYAPYSQPYNGGYAPYQPYAQPNSQPYQPHYAPAPTAQLTVDEQWLLQRGFISNGQYIGGGVASLFLGFGVGQAIQGRWGEKGWIFTVGEGASLAAMMYGMFEAMDCDRGYYDEYYYDDECEERGMNIFILGIVGFTAFRVWEIVDAWSGPPRHNNKLRALHARIGMPVPIYTELTPYVKPARDGDGGTAGITLRF